MSRQVDQSDLGALDQEDLEYLVARGRISQEEFDANCDSEAGEDGYASLSKAELKDVIKGRNADYDEDYQLSTSGSKQDLIDTLEADDAEDD